MRTSVKTKALRLDDSLTCKREPRAGGRAFVVRDGNGAELSADHWDASSAWSEAYRKLLDRIRA